MQSNGIPPQQKQQQPHQYQGKSAQQKQQPQKPLIAEIVMNVFDKIAQVLVIPFLFLENLSGRWRILPYGLMTGYFTLLNTESYYLNLDKNHTAFLPKLAIQDNANFANFFDIVGTPSFLIATLFSIITTAVTAQWLRDQKALQEAKRKYDEVKDINLGAEPQNAPDFVIHRRRQFKRAGMKQVRLTAGAYFLAFGVDIGSSLSAFPPIGEMMGVHILWALASSFGSEISFVLTAKAWEEMKLFPRTQVVK